MENGTAQIKGELKTPTAGVKSRIKSMFNLMYDYALEYEIVTINYARTFNVSDDIINEKEQSKRGHIIFSEEEMEKLWSNVDLSKYVKVILLQCYSGWRPQELGLIKVSDVDLQNGIMKGGIKTDAGKDRIVPIHEKIKVFVEEFYNEAISLGSEYLINCTDTRTHTGSYKLTYDKYQHRYKKIIEQLKLNPEHRAHDPRKHFITMAKKAKLDEYAIKYIVGHSINDITERDYTERDIQWLKEEMTKIK